MVFVSPAERSFLTAVSQLAYCNHFLPERARLERAALGREYVEGEPVWSMPVEEPERPRANVWRIVARMEPLAEQLRGRLLARTKARDADLVLYEDAIIHLLYQRYYPKFFAASFGSESEKSSAGRWSFYREFLTDWRHFFEMEGLPAGHDPVHIFACFRQIQRAFEQIFRDIIGGSMPAATLRAAVWQSIFTHDMRRYRRTLYARMSDFATLITGPSGTGKELVARAIAQSRYVPFDDKKLGFADEAVTFYPINISALSPTLVESELFGHRRGSFTGAIGDRKGWLETCPHLGSVFLDELGDLDPSIQVKLLRVIETRTFHPVGGTASRGFQGKLIAATNRDLAAGIRAGRFREDLYYRLCSDQIATPSLAEQLADSPQMLRELVVYMARRVAGAEGEELAGEVIEWIERNLEPGYPWPGNYRELEQCVKNVLIRRNYRPARSAASEDPIDQFAADLRAGRLTADQALSRYSTIVYRQTGSYEETARRLEIDRRTVKSKIDREFLGKLST
ncbi:MAG TPA: sigma 54-interacting transcriptional regulator [Bryobacteraceae bacterium]|nr:sigma 54-interacting transcriptional regulator [Bryobacteraceae bacterium]